MANAYRVVDLREVVEYPPEVIVEDVRSPEAAAALALGLPVVRSGAKRALVARVYWQNEDQPPSMVRLYRPVD